MGPVPTCRLSPITSTLPAVFWAEAGAPLRSTAAAPARISAVSFPTIEFAAFFVVVFIVSWALMPHPRAWRPFILIASYVFYGWVDWRWVLLLIASSVVNTFAARVIARSESQVTQARARRCRGFRPGLLGTFKYFGFFVDEFNSLLDGVGLGSPLPDRPDRPADRHLVLHVPGDLVRRRRVPRRDAGGVARDVAILQAFFPHLVAGPIVRANELLPQLRTPRDPRAVLAGPGLFLIAGGLIKKTVVADELARRVVDPVYNDPVAHSGGEILLAFYAFAAQIYCDFSGYTDMAIGTALLLGFQLPQNFNRPYAAVAAGLLAALAHHALALAARLPLHPARRQSKGERKTYRNLMITMLLGGFWHGASFTFLIWGGIHGTALSVERWGRQRYPSFRMPVFVAWFVTFNVVCVAWVFFRAPNLGTAFDILGGIGLSGPSPLVTLPMVFLVVAAIAVQFLPGRVAARGLARRAPVAFQGIAIGALIVAADAAVGQQGVAPFIYFQF